MLVLYDEKTCLPKLIDVVNEYIKTGYSVSAQKKQNGLRYKTLVDVTGDRND